MQHWHRKSSELVYETRIFELIKSNCVTEDGKKKFEFHTIQSLDWVHVIPLIKSSNKEDQVVLVRQFRHGIQLPTLEFPGGIIDTHETPQNAAVRELVEETGYMTKSITPVASYFPNPALFSNTCHSFVAELDPNPSTLHLDETESVEVVIMSFAELIRDPLKYGFNNAVLLAGLFLFLNKFIYKSQ